MITRHIRIGSVENLRIRVDRIDSHVCKVRVYLHANGIQASEWYAIDTARFDAYVDELRRMKDGSVAPVSVESVAADFILKISISTRGFLACEVKMKRSAVYPEKLKAEGWSLAAVFGTYPSSIALRDATRKSEKKEPNQAPEPTAPSGRGSA